MWSVKAANGCECAYCGTYSSKPLVCGQCGLIPFCEGKSCARSHFPQHRVFCLTYRSVLAMRQRCLALDLDSKINDFWTFALCDILSNHFPSQALSVHGGHDGFPTKTQRPPSSSTTSMATHLTCAQILSFMLARDNLRRDVTSPDRYKLRYPNPNPNPNPNLNPSPN